MTQPSITQSALPVDSLAAQDDKVVTDRETPNSPMLSARTMAEQELEQYAEQIDSMSPEQLMALLHESSFFNLLDNFHVTSLGKLLDCSLQGASIYRNLMKILRTLLQSEIDPHLIIGFSTSIHIPDVTFQHLKGVLEHPTMRKEVFFYEDDLGKSSKAASFLLFSHGFLRFWLIFWF